MGYSQKLADQNKAMATRAKTLLNERGYNPSLETMDDNGRLNGPQREIIKNVVRTIATEFEAEHIPLKRIQNQVFGVCRKERGRLWRERQNQ